MIYLPTPMYEEYFFNIIYGEILKQIEMFSNEHFKLMRYYFHYQLKKGLEE